MLGLKLNNVSKSGHRYPCMQNIDCQNQGLSNSMHTGKGVWCQTSNTIRNENKIATDDYSLMSTFKNTIFCMMLILNTLIVMSAADRCSSILVNDQVLRQLTNPVMALLSGVPFINMDWTKFQHGWVVTSVKCVWGEITHLFPNGNSCAAKFWEQISNFITHFITDVITYPCWD